MSSQQAWKRCGGTVAAGLLATLAMAPSAQGAAGKVGGDFDGDGYEDLAIGSPHHEVGGVDDAGAVTVIYGAKKGLRLSDAQLFDEDTSGVAGTAEDTDLFGSALAAGDFDNDGFDDLAIGVVNQNVSGVNNAGKVQVIGGNASGLDPVFSMATGHEGDYEIAQGADGVEGTPSVADSFGAELVAGNFDGNAGVDLAIGASRDNDGSNQAGGVNVLYSVGALLTDAPDEYFTEDTAGVPGVNGNLDSFGSRLAAGLIDGDSADDLVIGAPSDDDLTLDNAGAVTVLYGAPSGGIGVAGAQRLVQGFDLDGEPIRDSAELDDGFGKALAVGDFDHDGFGDLAVGIEDEDTGNVNQDGAVAVFEGRASGLIASNDRLITRKTKGIRRVDEFDRFGAALAAGRFDGGAFTDLAVGAGGASVAGGTTAGSFHALLGSSKGLQGKGSRRFTQETKGMPGAAEDFDEFGSVLAVGRFDQGSRDDVAVTGTRDRPIGDTIQSGSVTAVYADGSMGLRTERARYLAMGLDGLLGVAGDEDSFGLALASGAP